MLEEKINRVINVLRYLAGARWGGSTDGLLLLHTALVRQTIAYSIPVLHGLSPTLEKRLTYMIARSLRVCLGLPRATSSDLVIAEAKEPPVPVLREQETCRHYLRLASHSHARPLCQKILRRTESSFHRLLVGLPVAAPHHAHWLPSLINPPWTIPSLEIQTEIPGLGSKSSVAPLVAKTISLSHLEARYKDDIHIYTDGSTSNKGSTSAYSIPMLDTFKCFRLSHHTCSTSAELHAILSASSFIEAFGTPSNWVILTDSKSSLELLQGMHLRTSQATILYRVQLTLAQARLHGHNVRLQWIPSHCQIAGNEEADRLAAQAHDGDAMEATSFTSGDAKFILRHLRHLRCRQCWLKDTSANTLLPYIDPDFELPPHTGMKRKYDALIHRLRLEVAFTNSFLFRIKRRDSPRCDCGEPYQDVQHILLDCERFRHERRRMEIRLQILDDRPLSLTKLLGPWPTRKKQDRAMNIIHDFLKDTRIVYEY
ncbi:uncharacterized protein LOC121835741 [Ixodes scapularis]|uniref:uncharacterized protein LOC121835741 n=1 Tax=Ixodes scapularis TaxID=6945 RepID=UPI001C38BDDE|nr:uncharacterized protein LOC121835741 [Ixodes scapularis]